VAPPTLEPARFLTDVHARLTRALEALRDGDRDFAEQVLDDLASETWAAIEAEEHPRAV
jgi:hypothetical protein